MGAGSTAAPSWNGGIKSGEGAGRPLLGSRSGSRVAGKEGARSFGRDPPLWVLGCLVALLLALAPSAGPPFDARFLPLPGSVRLSSSWATGEGADGASLSPGSLGRCSHPCMPLAAETRSACGSLRMAGRVTYDPRPVGAPVALGWPVCPYRQQLATPWPIARQCSHDGAPCVGQSPPVEPRPLPSPRREEGTPCAAAGCAAPELADYSAGRAGGQRGRRFARWYGRRGALPAGAGGKNPPKKLAIGAACRGLLSRCCHCVTQCAAKPSSILIISPRAAK